MEGELRALACEADARLGRALTILLQGCGFGAVTAVRHPEDVLPVASRVHPHAVVLNLAMSGTMGLRLIPALLEAAPGSALVVVSPFPALHLPALAAGAHEVVDPSDLRPLRRFLEAEHDRPGLGCLCCPTFAVDDSGGFSPQPVDFKIRSDNLPPAAPPV